LSSLVDASQLWPENGPKSHGDEEEGQASVEDGRRHAKTIPEEEEALVEYAACYQEAPEGGGCQACVGDR
jgi:hypothetical protein